MDRSGFRGRRTLRPHDRRPVVSVVLRGPSISTTITLSLITVANEWYLPIGDAHEPAVETHDHYRAH